MSGRERTEERDVALADGELVVIDPKPGAALDADSWKGSFRVHVRVWDDEFQDLDAVDQIPPAWTFYRDAPSAGAAYRAALDDFPNGARQHPVFDAGEELDLDLPDIARISIDVRRLGLPQAFKARTSFYLVGELDDDIPGERLPELAGHLAAIFPVAIVARDARGAAFGVTVGAESFDEASTDLVDALEAFATSCGLEGDLSGSHACGPGERDKDELLRELHRYRRDRI